MKKTIKKFTWDGDESGNQDSAVERIKEIADEHEIEAFLSGGEQFADYILANKKKFNDFTVDDFQRWKSKVAEYAITAIITAETFAFNELVAEKMIKAEKKK